MDKEQIIQEFNQRISNFFDKKATDKTRNASEIKLIVSLKNDIEINYEVWDTRNNFLGYEKLANILNIKLYERIFINEQKISDSIRASMVKVADELKCQPTEVQLLIKQNENYILLNRVKHKPIVLNEIVL